MIHGCVKVFRPSGKHKRRLKLVKIIESEALELTEPEYGTNSKNLGLLASLRKAEYQARTDQG